MDGQNFGDATLIVPARPRPVLDVDEGPHHEERTLLLSGILSRLLLLLLLLPSLRLLFLLL